MNRTKQLKNKYIQSGREDKMSLEQGLDDGYCTHYPIALWLVKANKIIPIKLQTFHFSQLLFPTSSC
jgi:hypothetical protein